MEQIYTIPLNEAFDRSAADSSCGCPFCALSRKLEEDNLELILGASMMEPDVRIKTNKAGFCRAHYDRMFVRKNRLGLALMLESHLDGVKTEISKKSLIGTPGAAAQKRLDELAGSCYLCERIEFSLSKMLETAVYLYDTDSTFAKKLTLQPYFCLPHYRRLIALGKAKLSKKAYAAFYEDISRVVGTYFESLCGDIKHFIKKFDYRYEDEPWGNSKDSVERAIKFTEGDIHVSDKDK